MSLNEQLSRPFLYEPGAERGEAVLRRGRNVVQTLADALEQLHCSLDEQFVAACELIHSAQRQLVVSGMGKSGIIARKIAATFASTGTPAVFVHPAEAAHGDLGMLAVGDVVLVLSNSGNTPELRPVLNYARRIGLPVIAAASSPGSMIMMMADVAIIMPKVREACAANIAPTSSTTMQLALGDALAMAVMDMKGIAREHLGLMHPGGAIGLQLTRVDEIMHCAAAPLLVSETADMREVVSVMTSGRQGLAGVVNGAGSLVGVITDGDIRRHFDNLATTQVAAIMTPSPKLVTSDMLGGDALGLLNDHAITAAFVVEASDPRCRPIGVIHMHDLVRYGLG
jgi:arabinose-5-phosphate isomerase